ncbi:MAG: hypothetical protein KDI75_06355 [Xanthomonadales bacterium]|nr:hypothetical protein [Xanthomonadales bacterium]
MPIRRCHTVLAALTLGLGLVQQASASTQTAAATPAPPSCEGARHHQFDFWIGDWAVMNGGKQIGANRIVAVENGCAINEHWAGAGGGTGVSYSAYDRKDGKWHQFWVSGTGLVLHLVGAMENGAMVLHGELPAADGNGTTAQRVTWTPRGNGNVRQHWESAKPDGGWQTVFDGLYVRASE